MTDIIKAYAKVNLSLAVLDKRPDWYHNLISILQKISLADTIYFESRQNGISIKVTWKSSWIPTNSDNICFKAALEMRKYARRKQWISIHIHKCIDIQAWLGWGSSDGAEVIKYLNKAWEINFWIDRLIEISKKIWADLPFFVSGHSTAKVAWIWEIVDKCDYPLKWRYIALIKPNYIWINTWWAFNACQNFYCDTVHQIWLNSFEKPVFAHFPDLATIKHKFNEFWAEMAMMSGSWSTLFWIFTSKELANEAIYNLNQYWQWGVYEII